MHKHLFGFLLFVSSVGCSTASRVPASLPYDLQSEALTVYHEQNNLNLAEQKEVTAALLTQNDKGLEYVKVKLADQVQALDKSKLLLSSRSTSQLPQLSKLEYATQWRRQGEDLEVTDLTSYAFDGNEPSRTYFMALQDSRIYDLNLRQFATDPKGNLTAELSCDRDFEFSPIDKAQQYSAGTKVPFNWLHDDQKRLRVLRLRDTNAHCVLKYRASSSTRWSGQKLAPESEQFKDLLRLTHEFHACSLPLTNSLTGPEKFFLSDEFSSMSCPEAANIQLAGKPIEGLTERIKLLTGGFELPQSAIDARDPFVDLDFSKAPHFDVIVVSSLVFRSDFYGQLLARALLWHAQHGTIVRVLYSKILELKKDHAMFAKLIAQSDNIKLQRYSFHSTTNSVMSKVDKLLRVSHTKIFVAYSRSQPSASVVIVGGRNIAESYILPVAGDHLKFPVLVDYLHGEDSFLFYRDLEAIIHSHDFAETVIGHYLTFWEREPSTYIRSYSLNFNSTSQADANYFKSSIPLVRHVISLPYKDDQELMDVYASMIDSAEHEIKLTTPYFVPTKPVAKALERAVQRGVTVTLITKTDLTGDNPKVDFINSASNTMSANKYFDKFTIYDYQVPKSLLHSKLVLIDGKLSVIGSVNLNRRSFFHDVENATIVYSPEFNRELSAYYAEFISHSTPITGQKRVSFLKKIVVGIVKDEL